MNNPLDNQTLKDFENYGQDVLERAKKGYSVNVPTYPTVDRFR